jgi:hypothetical protein
MGHCACRVAAVRAENETQSPVGEFPVKGGGTYRFAAIILELEPCAGSTRPELESSAELGQRLTGTVDAEHFYGHTEANEESLR